MLPSYSSFWRLANGTSFENCHTLIEGIIYAELRNAYCYSYNSLRGRRMKGKGKRVLGARETRGAREEGGKDACQENIVFLVFNIHQANVKILIGQPSKLVNHSLNTLIRLVEINVTLLSKLIDLSVII